MNGEIKIKQLKGDERPVKSLDSNVHSFSKKFAKDFQKHCSDKAYVSRQGYGKFEIFSSCPTSIERTRVIVRNDRAEHKSFCDKQVQHKTQSNATSFKMVFGIKNYHVSGQIRCYKAQHFPLTGQKQLYDSLRPVFDLASRSIIVWHEEFFLF